MANWIKEYPRSSCQTFFCSECNTRVYYIDGMARGKYPKRSKCRYSFCPWCKAEMNIDEQYVLVPQIEKAD